MLLLRTDELPEGANLQYEVDGWRATALKSGGKSPPALAERQGFQLAIRYPAIVNH
jgi:hypothetical protein